MQVPPFLFKVLNVAIWSVIVVAFTAGGGVGCVEVHQPLLSTGPSIQWLGPLSGMPNARIRTEWAPIEDSFHVLNVSFLNEIGDEPYAFSGNLDAYLLMPSMGHGSRKIIVERLSPSSFRLRGIHFSMPEDWVLTLGLFHPGTNYQTGHPFEEVHLEIWVD